MFKELLKVSEHLDDGDLAFIAFKSYLMDEKVDRYLMDEKVDRKFLCSASRKHAYINLIPFNPTFI